MQKYLPWFVPLLQYYSPLRSLSDMKTHMKSSSAKHHTANSQLIYHRGCYLEPKILNTSGENIWETRSPTVSVFAL